jgi:mannose-6-phosphate isomerase-like protein (cupin superfamily)
MNISRRDLTFLLPALAAAGAAAQTPALPSKVFSYADLPVRASGANNTNKQRAVFDGPTHTGFIVEMHETELPPGQMPHAAHHHVHEELFILREGTVEVTIKDKTTRIEAGSVAYVASNEEHGWRNVGTTPARYYVIALGG